MSVEGLGQGNMEFLAQANAVVGAKTYTPGRIEWINHLRDSGRGVPIVTSFDLSSHPYDFKILVGMAFPLNLERTSHVVFLITGENLITMARSDRSKYVKTMTPRSGVSFHHVSNVGSLIRGFDNPANGMEISSGPGSISEDYAGQLLVNAMEMDKKLRDLEGKELGKVLRG